MKDEPSGKQVRAEDRAQGDIWSLSLGPRSALFMITRSICTLSLWRSVQKGQITVTEVGLGECGTFQVLLTVAIPFYYCEQ